MPAFAFAVGSLGDFLAMGGIVYRVAGALCDCSAAASERQKLITEMSAVCNILGSIEMMDDDSTTQRTKLCFRELEKEGEACAKTMLEFVNKQNPKEKSTWSTVKWAMWGQSDADDLQRKLSSHRQNLSLYWQRYGYQQSLDRDTAMRTDIRRIVISAVILVDGTGNRIQIDLALCSSYEALRRLVQHYYDQHGLLARDHVKKGDFELLDGQIHQEIMPTQWFDLATPGRVIEVSIIVRRSRSQSSDQCPKCNSRVQTKIIGQWESCKCSSGLFYLIINKARSHLLAPVTRTSDHANNGSILSQEDLYKLRLVKFITSDRGPIPRPKMSIVSSFRQPICTLPPRPPSFRHFEITEKTKKKKGFFRKVKELFTGDGK